MSGYLAALAALYLVLSSLPALAAADPGPPPWREHLNISVWALTWISTGQTINADNGSFLSPLLGNPSSRLNFDRLHSTIFEVGGEVRLRQDWFVRAAYGRGGISSGQFTDDDFVSAQGAAFFQTATPGAQMISRSISNVGGGSDVWYVTVDAGRRVLTYEVGGGKGAIDAFLGFQFWREHYEVIGGSQVVCTSSPANSTNPFCNPSGTPFSGLSLTNSVEWRSLRLGVLTMYEQSRLRVDAEFAFIPYTSLFSEDSHLLRPDLRQPSFTLDGHGVGAQGQVDFSVRIVAALYLTVGYRYWWLQILDGTSTAHVLNGPDISDPLTEHRTIRQGVTVGASYRF